MLFILYLKILSALFSNQIVTESRIPCNNLLAYSGLLAKRSRTCHTADPWSMRVSYLTRSQPSDNSWMPEPALKGIKSPAVPLGIKISHIPPWQQNIFSSTMAAIGKQLKQSVKVFHSLMLYLLLPVKILGWLKRDWYFIDSFSQDNFP